MNKKITVFTTTNFVESSPSTRLLETVIANLEKQTGLKDYRHIIHFDMPRRPEAKHRQYAESLRKLGRELICSTYAGLKGAYLKVLPTIDTPYFVFLEHDWLFLEEIDLNRLAEILDENKYINYIKFNKRKNALAGWDIKLEEEARAPIPLTKCWIISNNPHIARTSVAKSKWLPLIDSPRNRWAKPYGDHAGAFGVEDPLTHAIKEDVKKMGFAKAHTLWGTYIYGPLNYPPVIKHIDGKAFK